jgi:coenzyme F420-reducing hydrogenase beta subunit
MKDVRLDEECYGCTACANICPKRAIIMKELRGFYYPVVDLKTCNDCGMCIKVCPLANPKHLNYDLLEKSKVYAAINKSDETRKNSSSGGVFIPISDYILEQGGVVYGAKYNNLMDVVHCGTSNKENRDNFIGSKYVQSNLGDSYKKIKQDLGKDKVVLFSGTPCQISGLYSYLSNNKNLHNLYTIDLVCHGVPSPIIFKEYVKYMEIKHNSKVKMLYFRCKDMHGLIQCIKIVFKNGSQYISKVSNDLYYRLFLYNLILRPACYKCKWASKERLGDITLGDFWGINNCYPEFNDGLGVSLMYVNTKKGLDIFHIIEDKLNILEADINDCKQSPLFRPPHKPWLISKLVWLFAKENKFNNNYYIISALSNIPRVKFALLRKFKRTFCIKGDFT